MCARAKTEDGGFKRCVDHQSRARSSDRRGDLSFAQIECARARKEGRRCRRFRSRRRQSHTFRGGERNDDWRIEDPPKKSKRARSPKAIIAMIVAPLSLSLSLSLGRKVRASFFFFFFFFKSARASENRSILRV